MKQIELKTKTSLWVAFFILFFAFSSISLIYVVDLRDLVMILSVAFLATVIIITVLISIYNSYKQIVILSDNEIRIFGIPSEQNVVFEGSNRLIHKYFIEEKYT